MTCSWKAIDKIYRVFYNWFMNTKNKPIITMTLIVINAVIYLGDKLLEAVTGTAFFFEQGAMYGPYILEGGEYYRLFTSMFLHFDFPHILNNMFMLAVFGYYLEEAYGRVKFLLTYLVSGLCGSLLSLVLHTIQGILVVSAGASGAIYGTMGIMAALIIKNWNIFRQFFGQRIFLMIALCLYYGLNGSGLDNYAHAGGLFGGFLIAMLFYRRPQARVND